MAGEDIENELKFVLGVDRAALEAELSSLVPVERLTAGYLNPETRIRREESGPEARCVFTFKRRLPDGRNIEIAKEIGPEIFGMLWPDTGDRLCKRRCSFADGPVKWDVDFFGEEGRTYFAMAEVEMPADMEVPPRILPVLEGRIAFAVPRDDARFASRLLADESYARKLAAELGLA